LRGVFVEPNFEEIFVEPNFEKSIGGAEF